MAACLIFGVLAVFSFSCGEGAQLGRYGTRVRLPFLPRPPVGAPVDPEIFMNASELITSKGYPVERRAVQTADGYILGLQRIPHGVIKSSNSVPKPVVLLQHGLLASSAGYLENLANESLAFILADAGMDVWLGNSRGNVYSRKHVSLNPEQNEFWQFSWDEMAKYDVPAMIDYILNVTGQSQIYYVGHSQGTEIAFAAFSSNQELAKKVKTFFALAPVAFVSNMKSPLRLLLPFSGAIDFLWELFGHGEFLPKSEFSDLLASEVCTGGVGNFLCENYMFLINGFDFEQTNATRVPVYMSHRPAGTSVRNMLHYVQALSNGKFAMYDFGSSEKNMEHYNQTTPPEYDATQMKVPVALFSGTNDWLSDPKDIAILVPQLPNVIQNHVIEGWSHTDFLVAMDAPGTVYRDIINIIKQAERRDD